MESLTDSSAGSLKRLKILTILILCTALCVTVVYWPSLSSKAFCFDDEEYLFQNQLVQNPGWDSAKRFSTEILHPSTVRGYYQPLAMISLMLDYAMGGRADDVTVFRITSLALHVTNTILIIVLLYQLFGNIWAAVIAGLIFGIHPLTVEPIPWLSERKTLLAAFFALFCLNFYVRFSRTSRKRNYVFCMVFLLLSLLSKPIAIPLPLLMILLDYWPLQRINKKVLIEKIPFVLLAVIAAIVTFVSQKNTAFATIPDEHGWFQMPLLICHNIIFYLHKFLLPLGLSAYYPFPEPFDLSQPVLLVGLVGSCVLVAFILFSVRWTRALITGWLFFFIAVFPTLGVVSFHPVIAADRHAYLPMLGFLLPIAAFLAWLFLRLPKNFKWQRAVFATIIIALLGAESFATRSYLSRWKDTVTNYQHMLSLAPNEMILHNNIALALSEANRTDEAIEHYYRALELKSDSYETYNNLGNALLKKNQLNKAVDCYRKAISLAENKKSLRPKYGEAYYNLGNVLQRQNQSAQAIEYFKKALRFKPNDMDIHYGLGLGLSALNRFDEAADSFRAALKIKPDFALARYNLGRALFNLGQFDQAINHFRIVLEVYPNDPEMHCNLGIVLAQNGLIDEAIREFEISLRLDPDFIKAKQQLEKTLAVKAEDN